MKRRRSRFVTDESANQVSVPPFSAREVRKKEWACEICTLLNSQRRKKCAACQNSRDVTRFEKEKDCVRDEDFQGIMFEHVDTNAEGKALLSVEKGLKIDEQLHSNIRSEAQNNSVDEHDLTLSQSNQREIHHPMPHAPLCLQEKILCEPIATQPFLYSQTSFQSQTQQQSPLMTPGDLALIPMTQAISSTFEYNSWLSQTYKSSYSPQATPTTIPFSYGTSVNDQFLLSSTNKNKNFDTISKQSPGECLYINKAYPTKNEICKEINTSSFHDANGTLGEESFVGRSGKLQKEDHSNNSFERNIHHQIKNQSDNISMDMLAKADQILQGGTDSHNQTKTNSNDIHPCSYTRDTHLRGQVEVGLGLSRSASFFSTAGSGRPVEVSIDALAKADQILQGSTDRRHQTKTNSNDIHPSSYTRDTHVRGQAEVGLGLSRSASLFSTAGSGRPVEVSMDALAKADQILQGSTDRRHQTKTNSNDIHPSSYTRDTHVRGQAEVGLGLSRSASLFSTAGSGRPVEVSMDALAKADQILQGSTDRHHQTKTNSNDIHPSSYTRDTHLRGQAEVGLGLSRSASLFSTAGSGRPVEVSMDALAKADQILQGSTDRHHQTKTNSNDIHPSSYTRDTHLRGQAEVGLGLSRSASLFSTAGSGRPVEVSMDALAKADQILQGSTDRHNQTKTNSNDIHPCSYTRDTHLRGQVEVGLGLSRSASLFSTAGSGRPVEVSIDALAKADQILQGSTDRRHQTKTNSNDIHPSSYTRDTHVRGQAEVGLGLSRSASLFSTAGSGRPVEVSMDALAKADQILQGSTDRHHQTKTNSNDIHPSSYTRDTHVRGQAEVGLGLSRSASLFSTAGSGRPVEVSMDALAKADQILQGSTDRHHQTKTNSNDIHPSSYTRDTHVRGQAEVGLGLSRSASLFSTAGSGRPVEVSIDALAKADQILQGSTDRHHQTKTNSNDIHPSSYTRDTHLRGQAEAGLGLSRSASLFSTAGSGRPVEVSMDALAKADQILQGSTDRHHQTKTNSNDIHPSRSASLFSTAGSGRPVEVSMDALAKADQILQGGTDRHHQTKTNSNDIHPSRSASLFSTAGSGRPVEVSMDALAKADQILQGSTDRHHQTKTNSNDIHPCSYTRDTHLRGQAEAGLGLSRSASLFSTAGSGRPVEVSMDALAKADQILQGSTDRRHQTKTNSNDIHPSRSASLFSTAGSGRPVEVSMDALAKADQILQGSTDSHNQTKTNSNDIHPSRSASLFSTAGSGRPVEVSMDALAKADQILQGSTDRHNQTKTNSNDIHPSRSASLFSTAGSGRPVEVSIDALAKADQILQGSTDRHHQTKTNSNDIHPCSYTRDTHLRGQAEAGLGLSRSASLFSTAGSGRPVEVSMDAIAKADQILQGSIDVSLRPKAAHVALDSFVCNFADEHADSSFRSSISSLENSSLVPFCGRIVQNDSILNDEMTMILAKGQLLIEPDRRRKESTPNHDASAITAVPSCTPVTPHVKPLNVVTRSTGVRNPYQRKRKQEDSCHSALVIGRQRCTQPRFSDAVDRSDTVHKLIEMSGRQAHSIDNDILKPRNVSTIVHTNSFNFSPYGKKIKLSSFARRSIPFRLFVDTRMESGVRPIVTKISAHNASKLRFDSDGYPHSFFGENIGQYYGGIADLRKQLLFRGCSDSSISDLWLNNHYRWICWKLAATERRFPQLLAGKYLTYEHVLIQLYRRYQIEIISGNRPILRRILNRDIAASYSMMLCVSKIVKKRKSVRSEKKVYIPSDLSADASEEEITIEVTDGWYCIAATIDKFLQEQVLKNKIVVGCKLMVTNAVLEGCDEGIDPLDSKYLSAIKSATVRLKLSANSTRIGHWAAKLGLIKMKDDICESTFMIKSLRDIIPGGGAIPFMHLFISKRYPVLFMEQLSNSGLRDCKATETYRVLSADEEEYYAQMQQKLLERFIDKISEEAHCAATKDIGDLAPPVWKLMMMSSHQENFYSSLSDIDKQIIDDWELKYPRLIQDKARQIVDSAMQSNADMIRASTPFLRLLVQAYSADSRNDEDHNQALLTVWNVTDDLLDILTEGAVVSTKNIFVKGSQHDGLLQLSAGSWTSFELLSPQPDLETLRNRGFFCTHKNTQLIPFHLVSMELLESNSQVFPEYDMIGYLMHIEQQHGHIKIYLTDESGRVVRVDRFIDVNSHIIMSQLDSMKRNCAVGVHTILFLQNVRVMPFDSVASCAVGLWTQSSIQIKEKHERYQDLLSWVLSEQGTNVLNTLRAAVKARIPSCGHVSQKYSTAVGYIETIQVHDYDMNLCRIQIDCMGSIRMYVNFPCHLLQHLLRMYDEDNNDSDHVLHVAECTVQCDDWLTMIQNLINRKEILVQMILQDVGGQYYVEDVRESDVIGLSRLLMSS